MHAFLSSVRREGRLLLQRPWDLAMISWVPVLGALLMWWIFSAGLTQTLPIAVLDEDHSALSRQITRYLNASPGLRVVPMDNAPMAEQSLRRLETLALVTLPRDLETRIRRGQSAEVMLGYNAQYATHSGNITRDVRTVLSAVSAGLEMRAHTLRGGSEVTATAAALPVLPRSHSLFNLATNYERFLAVALIPALLHILAAVAGAWSVGVELRDCTLRHWIPEHAGFSDVAARLIGKLLWPWIGLSSTGILALIGMTWGRGWHPAGSLAWVALGFAVFMALSLLAGALLAAGTRSLRTGLSFGGLVSAPAFAFSGLGFPRMSMPESAQMWSSAMPYTHYIRLQTEQLLMGVPWTQNAGILSGLLAACAILWLLGSAALLQARHAPHTWGRR